MHPPNSHRPKTPKQLAILQRAKERRFAGIIAALEANSKIRQNALDTEAPEPKRRPAATSIKEAER